MILDLSMNMTWQGRELRSVVNENETTAYGYDTNGYRLRKSIGSEDTEYYYSDGQLVYEKRKNDEFFYSYDFNGNLSRIRHKNANGVVKVYYVAVNTRGDVIRIIFDNETNPEYIEYIYDSWGNVVSIKDEDGNLVTSTTNIGNLNKIRYRGYYYDDETGFYYLVSRYYNPEVGRFLNADGYISTGTGLLGHNMFSYCGNNPVNYMDSTENCYTNARGDTIHFNCKYDPRIQFSVLKSVSTSRDVLGSGIDMAFGVSRNAYSTEKKSNYTGIGQHKKNIDKKLSEIDSAAKVVNELFEIADFAIITTEIWYNVYLNCKNKASDLKIVWDVMVDSFVLTINAYVSTYVAASVVGLVAGPPGVVLAVFAGLGAGYILGYAGDEARKEAKGWVK